MKILAETDACKEWGQIGAILRREGIYSSQLNSWRNERERALKPKKRGIKTSQPNPWLKQMEALQTENNELKAKLQQAQILIDLQKKISEILTIPLTTPNNDCNIGRTS